MFIQTVKDIPADYHFIQDSQEVELIKERIGKSDETDIEALFVKEENGDYVAVFGLKRNVPYMDSIVHKLLY